MGWGDVVRECAGVFPIQKAFQPPSPPLSLSLSLSVCV